MTLFKHKSFKRKAVTFNKDKIIREILEQKNEKCPGWNFFNIVNPIKIKPFDEFDKINGDFLAIYTDMISERITVKGNPFSEFKKIVDNPYQIVREVFITEETDVDTYESNNGNPQTYKKIAASSEKELFTMLKKELNKE